MLGTTQTQEAPLTGFILPAPFGTHRFNDHRHAGNFVRYLFSQSKGHPVGDRTPLNLITETAEDGSVLRRYRNTEPQAACRRFLAERMPAENAHRTLVDDGAYVLFLLPLPGGGGVSNILRAQDGDYALFGPRDVVGLGVQTLGQERIRAAIRTVSETGQIRDLDAVSEAEHEAVDAAVHDHLLKFWKGRPLILASHHDQRTAPDTWHTNPFYHVHRLRLKEGRE